MRAAIALSERGRVQSAPNPNVGCIMERYGRVLGRGWTQPGGRPHAEAMALAETGKAARGATAWVTLEPCAHQSERGPSCADMLIEAGVARVVAALADPDPRTAGQGLARLRAAGIKTECGVDEQGARIAMQGWLTRKSLGRPFISLKLATSLDGCIARSDGESRWITSEQARAHGHMQRARHSMILVGRGTLETDQPKLDARLPGLEARSPARALLSQSGSAPLNWMLLQAPKAVHDLPPVIDSLLVEGGAGAASAFLAAGLVDQLLLYRAPILIGSGRASLGDIGLSSLASAHGQWQLAERRSLGVDVFERYHRVN